jgi:uncharacterized PurR-regulated membrane protein YhhQ (DUF165 family)
MHALWLVLSCFTGVFGFGILLAGVLSCADFDSLESTNKEKRMFLLFDAVFFGSLGFLTSGIARNWTKQRDARRMVYAGLVSLAALVVFAGLALHTA